MAGFSKDLFSEDLNEKLQASSGGVDFMALKAKYSKIKSQQDSASSSKQVHQMDSLHQDLEGKSISSRDAGLASVTVAQSHDDEQQGGNETKTSAAAARNEEAFEVFRKLDRYKICRACNGLGLVQYKYNHMVLEKTCEVCDGDVIMDTEQPSSPDRATDITSSSAEAGLSEINSSALDLI